MRSIVLGIATSLALLGSAVLAQQPAAGDQSAGDSIGHPPPLPGPPPLQEPSATNPPAPPGSTPQATGQPASKGYTGAYAPSNAPARPYSTGALPSASAGPGLNVAGPDDTTRTVRAVPCGTSAHETDGFTTCVGLPDRGDESPRRRHRR